MVPSQYPVEFGAVAAGGGGGGGCGVDVSGFIALGFLLAPGLGSVEAETLGCDSAAVWLTSSEP